LCRQHTAHQTQHHIIELHGLSREKDCSWFHMPTAKPNFAFKQNECFSCFSNMKVPVNKNPFCFTTYVVKFATRSQLQQFCCISCWWCWSVPWLCNMKQVFSWRHLKYSINFPTFSSARVFCVYLFTVWNGTCCLKPFDINRYLVLKRAIRELTKFMTTFLAGSIFSLRFIEKHALLHWNANSSCRWHLNMWQSVQYAKWERAGERIKF